MRAEIEFPDREAAFALDARLSPGSPLVHRYWDYISRSLAPHLLGPCCAASEVDLVNSSSPVGVDLVNAARPVDRAAQALAGGTQEKLAQGRRTVSTLAGAEEGRALASALIIEPGTVQRCTKQDSAFMYCITLYCVSAVLHGAGAMAMVDPPLLGFHLSMYDSLPYSFFFACIGSAARGRGHGDGRPPG